MLALDNELNIKIIQEINRERRTEKTNQKDPEPPFKLERFKNIASKFLVSYKINRYLINNIRTQITIRIHGKLRIIQDLMTT
jgi:hypothetical protein